MTALLATWRTRIRPLYCATATAGLVAAGVALAVAPALMLNGAWPPLHARCVAATALSLGVAMGLALRTRDPAALRMPLLALAWWALSSAVLAWLHGGLPAFVPAAMAAVGAGALALARVDDDPPAPAQRALRVWLGFAALALLVAAPLVVAPLGVVPHWPWRLGAALVAQYAPMFLAWGVAAWLLSRERRRYVRLPVLGGVFVWAAGVLLASLWHRGAFKLGEPVAWLWFGAFLLTAALAARQLRPMAWGHRRRALGL